MEKKIENIIYDWVKEHFGESEANDPSWNIEALSKHLANKFHDLYWQQELEYLKEDVEHYVEENGYDLTEQQKYYVADKIRESESYCSIDLENMKYFIDEELKKK